MKTCIDCGSEEISERKRCRECALIYNRERVKKYYKKDKPRYGIVKCDGCGEDLIKGSPNQTTHGKCKVIHKTVDNYNSVRRSSKGNTLARQIVLDLGFQLNSMLHIHHIDENPDNNILSNFMIMSASNHSKLHRLLEKKWSLLMKISSSNLENCWNILRDQLTTTWLETANVNVIKITDIGQSAAEPLNEDHIYVFSDEEGSETKHQVPKS